MTVLGGVAGYFFIYNSPEEAMWLTPDERAYIRARLRYDGNTAGNALQEGSPRKKYVRDAFTIGRYELLRSPQSLVILTT
jgi:hypothetical protein